MVLLNFPFLYLPAHFLCILPVDVLGLRLLCFFINGFLLIMNKELEEVVFHLHFGVVVIFYSENCFFADLALTTCFFLMY